MGGPAWADLARHIGARRRDRSAKGGQQTLRLRMCRNTQGYFFEAGTGQHGDWTIRLTCQHECHGSGPESIGQRCRHGGPVAKRKSGIGCCHMADQGVEFGSVLRRKDTGHGSRIIGIGAKAIDCLSGECNKPSHAQSGGGTGNAQVG